MAKKKNAVLLSKATEMILPLFAALMLLTVLGNQLGWLTISTNMSAILSIFAIGIILLESKDVPNQLGKVGANLFTGGVLAVAVVFALAVFPPIAGFTVPIISEIAPIITMIGVVVALALMFVGRK